MLSLGRLRLLTFVTERSLIRCTARHRIFTSVIITAHLILTETPSHPTPLLCRITRRSCRVCVILGNPRYIENNSLLFLYAKISYIQIYRHFCFRYVTVFKILNERISWKRLIMFQRNQVSLCLHWEEMCFSPFLNCPRLMEAECRRVGSEFQTTGTAVWKVRRSSWLLCVGNHNGLFLYCTTFINDESALFSQLLNSFWKIDTLLIFLNLKYTGCSKKTAQSLRHHIFATTRHRVMPLSTKCPEINCSHDEGQRLNAAVKYSLFCSSQVNYSKT